MDIRTIVRSFGLGATCGLRSMAGPTLTRWRAGDSARLAFAALALGELIADKLPATPSRTIPPALLFRALSGAFSSASSRSDLSPSERVVCGIAGSLGALAAAYAGMALRSALVRWTRLPDPLIAVAEDALALGGAAALTRA